MSNIGDLDYPGLPVFNWDGTDTRDLLLPMVIISAKSAYTLLDYVSKYGNVTVRVTSNGKLTLDRSNQNHSI